MWQPLSSLPMSNAGALAAYAPAPVPPVPAPGVQTAPVAGQVPLHPIYGGHGRGPLMSLSDPNGFRGALDAWKLQRPTMPMTGATPMPSGNFMDLLNAWRAQRPMRSDY